MILLTAVRLTAVGAGFLTSVLAARLLGATALGAAGVALSIATIGALVGNGGLNISAIYFLGQRPSTRRDTVARISTLGMVAIAVAAVLILATAPLTLLVFGKIQPELVLSAALAGGGIVAFELAGSLLLGLDQRSAYLASQGIEGVGSLAFSVVILIFVSTSAVGYVAAAAASYWAAAIYAGIRSHREVGGRVFGFDKPFTREAISLGLRGQVGNILQFLNLRLDLLLVPVLIDLHAAGVYLIAVRMSEIITQIASAASAFLFPAVSRGELNQTRLTERTVRATLLVITAMGIMIVLTADLLLGVFFGPEFQAGTNALRITIAAMIPLSLTRLLAGDLKGRGRPGLVSLAAGCAVVATVLLDLILIPAVGIAGAAMASFLAYTTGAIALLAAFRGVTGASLWQLLPTFADVKTLWTGVRRLGELTQR